MIRERSGKVMCVLVLAAAAGLLITASAGAGLVTEDFEGGNNDAAIDGRLTGTGWEVAWGPGGATSRARTKINANLSYSGGGYSIAQTGTGQAYGDYNAFRGINRAVATHLTGEVWFSLLVRNVEAGGHGGIQFNNHSDSSTYSGIDYNRGAFDVGIAVDDLVVRYGGADTVIDTSFAFGQTHLIVGRIVVGAGNDTLQVWVDPADLSNIGSPLFNQSDADMGNDVNLVGIFGYGDVFVDLKPNSYIDALRLSDTGTAFLDVTGVTPIPTPAALPAGLALLGLLGLQRRR